MIVVRIHGGQPRRRARLAAPLSYCGQPGSIPGGGSMRSWRNGRRAGPRSLWSARAVEVQFLSGALRLRSSTAEHRSCKPGTRVRHLLEALDGRLLCRQGRRDFESRHDAGSSPARPAHACLVITAARLLGTEAVRVRFPGQAPRGCSSGEERDLAMVEAPGSKPGIRSHALVA
jgi:hypothetical protein